MFTFARRPSSHLQTSYLPHMQPCQAAIAWGSEGGIDRGCPQALLLQQLLQLHMEQQRGLLQV
jgi:hypothetical protein